MNDHRAPALAVNVTVYTEILPRFQESASCECRLLPAG